MKRFLVTRPLEDALTTAGALEARGYKAEIIPLLTISFDNSVSFADIDPQGLLISSANGIRAFAKADSRRDLDVLTVGPASAEEAIKFGFQSVEAAGGDVASLVERACQRYRREGGALCHVAGRAVAGNLASELKAKGFTVVQRSAYQAQALEDMPDALHDILSRPIDRNIGGILFYSRRTTRCFVDLVQAAGLESECSKFRAFCLSQAAAEPLSDLEMKSIAVSPEKTQSALLDLCDIE